jgi:hypothetical protein
MYQAKRVEYSVEYTVGLIDLVAMMQKFRGWWHQLISRLTYLHTEWCVQSSNYRQLPQADVLRMEAS